jgi:hypothetical protein
MLRRSLLSITLLALVAWGMMGRLPAQADGSEENRAAVAVRYPDGEVEMRCVGFDEPAITGEELLVRAGLSVVIDSAGSLGGAVCSIGGQGCRFPSEDCFCKCMGATCEYWAYYHWENGAWSYSQIGARRYEVRHGALEGWSWGAGDFQSGTEPPRLAFADVCRAGAQVYRGGDAATAGPAGNAVQYGAYALILLGVALMGLVVAVRRRGAQS